MTTAMLGIIWTLPVVQDFISLFLLTTVAVHGYFEQKLPKAKNASSHVLLKHQKHPEIAHSATQ